MIDVYNLDEGDWSTVMAWRHHKFQEFGFAWYPVPPELSWSGAYDDTTVVAACGYALRDGSLLVHDVYCADSRAGRRGLKALLAAFEVLAATKVAPLVFAVPVLGRAHPIGRHLAHWGYTPTLTMYAKENACLQPS